MSQRQRDSDDPGISHFISKALTPGADWPDKDDLLDVIYWGKQCLALVIGILFGVLNMTGILAIASYAAISTGATQHFVTKYQRVDDEELGGWWELAKEGFGAAFATFMVSWITIYSALHAE